MCAPGDGSTKTLRFISSPFTRIPPKISTILNFYRISVTGEKKCFNTSYLRFTVLTVTTIQCFKGNSQPLIWREYGEYSICFSMRACLKPPLIYMMIP